ncbi:MAG: glycosyltransferase family 9 protein [Candidatus Cloacimonetes bacterium]|nr:glycosyltransferase family 9 protein [Candidatus Cloacimonadota bacterium]MDD4560281.1 glycosyltransferase family 9 protein [Candidatus Cloacimonadota bacterium]
MILLTPVLELIYHFLPDVRFDFAVFQSSSMLPIRNAPYTSEVYQCSYKASKLLPMIAYLRRKKYDYCITTSGISAIKAGLFAWSIKARCRIGDYQSKPNHLYTSQIPFIVTRHRTWANYEIFKLIFPLPEAEAFRQNPLCSRLFRTRYYSKVSASAEAKAFFSSYFDETDFVVAIHPGCTAKNKYRRWNLDYFVDLVSILNTDYPALKFYVIAGPDELEESIALSKRITAPCLSGVSLDVVYETLKLSQMIINTDSGIGHIASCHQLPSFVIFGPGDERQTAPFNPQANIIRSDTPCAPCVQRKRTACSTDCLRNLKPKMVADIITAYVTESKLSI